MIYWGFICIIGLYLKVGMSLRFMGKDGVNQQSIFWLKNKLSANFSRIRDFIDKDKKFRKENVA